MSQRKKLAIIVSGGPAPGINSVIGAATIRSALAGVRVLGIRDGFRWIMHGELEHVTPLGIDNVSRIHFRGGSHLGMQRLQHARRRLAAGYAQVQALFLLEEQSIGVLLAGVAALAAILLGHRRHHSPPQRATFS